MKNNYALLYEKSNINVKFENYYSTQIHITHSISDDYNNYKSTTNQSRTAVFCYINGTRLVTQVRRNVYQSVPFTLEHINVDLCTHILYGAAMLDPNTWSIRPIDNDLENRQSTGTI